MTAKQPSLTDILELYILDRTPRKETIKLLTKVIRLFSKDTQVILVCDIKKHTLNLWKQKLLNRVQRTTCNSYFRQIKTLVLFAYEEEIILVNPFKKFRMVKEEERAFKSITQIDVADLIRYLKSEGSTLPPSWFWITVIRTLYYTGIRRRQLIGLKWENICFRNKTILLSAKYSKTFREWVIPLHDDIIEDLYYLKEQNHDCYGQSNPDLNNIQVFNVTLFNHRYSGNNMTTEQLSGFFRNLSNNTNIKGSAHRFRHRLATDLANQNGNIKDVQSLLGHSNISTTLGYIATDLHQIRNTLKTITPIRS